MIESWGKYPKATHTHISYLNWLSELPRLDQEEGTLLPHGLGRSYGDSCLNDGGALLCTEHLSRFISFDKEKALLRCEAGVSLAQILDLVVPLGFFLPVTPGTKFVTVGGAIANDVHGKNHHVAGTFGCHVTQFELLRSDGERLLCSPEQNTTMFNATIGGLGLTGVILWAEFRLQPIPSPFIFQENIRFAHIDDYLEHSRESDTRFDYVVSWIDCASTGKNLGRGIFMGGNFTHPEQHDLPSLPSPKSIPFPFQAPDFLLNKWSIKAFNELYYHKQYKKHSTHLVHYNPFFYPLDAISNWNRMYGKGGFFQYQFVVPFNSARDVLHEVLQRTAKAGKASFLAVLKNFGDIASPGMLSFPFPGVTLAMDFKNEGGSTLRLMSDLDDIIRTAGGRLYPAKDARMTAEDFQQTYPAWKEFSSYIDPKFSSSFWRRVSRKVEGKI